MWRKIKILEEMSALYLKINLPEQYLLYLQNNIYKEECF